MIRLLRSAESEPGITLIPELTLADVEAIHAGVGFDPAVRARLNPMEPKLRRELGSCFLWVLVRAWRMTLPEALDFLTLINKREELGTTGIGTGFAIPHAKSPLFQEIQVSCVLFHDLLFEYQSIDGEPIRGLFVMACPPSRPGEYMRVNLNRSPAIILKEIGDSTDPELIRRALIKNFRLHEPLTEEWHAASLADHFPDLVPRPPSEVSGSEGVLSPKMSVPPRRVHEVVPAPRVQQEQNLDWKDLVFVLAVIVVGIVIGLLAWAFHS